MLENDLILERFFARHGEALDADLTQGLDVLLELPDGELLDLILRRCEPQGEADTPAARRALDMLRQS